MSLIDRNNQQSADTVVLVTSDWSQLLHDENVRFHDLGLRSGVISVDFSGAPDPAVWRDRAIRLLRRSLRGTDRIGQTSDTSIALLLAPLQTIADLERTARQIDVQLHVAGLEAAIGYAHRRTGEDLLDTWARADAQADRAIARQEHGSAPDELRLP